MGEHYRITPAARKGITRREAINYCLVAAAGVAGGGATAWMVRNAMQPNPGAVFPGDAPAGEQWHLWQQRGWVKEGYHYLKLGNNVQCKICPNNCILAPGDRSHCRNKINKDGTLYTLAYGNPCAFHLDPVEKKPLFHFLPGSASFSIATAGCVFRCLNCQNWEISQKTPEETKDAAGPEFRLRPPVPDSLSYQEMARLSMFPEDVVAVAESLRAPSIAYTYSDPVAYYEYTYDTCKLAREKNLKNILVTCGSIDERALRDLGQYVDAAHVDLKGFDEQTYWKLNAGSLRGILDTLKTLGSMEHIWFEVINLVIPTYTENAEMIKRMCGWLADNLGPDRPLHFSRFQPLYKLAHLPPTPVETLVKARDIARAAGLRYVYIGNVRGLPDAETTFCPNCRRAIVERDIFAVTRMDIADGRCKHCQTKIAGVWG